MNAVYGQSNGRLPQRNQGQNSQMDVEPASPFASNTSPDSQSLDSDDTRTQSAELKSIGSAKHPDGCCECQFFFFSLTGCKKGQDCRYCHEFHPRAKEKKNRKLRRRLDEVGKKQEKLGIEASHSFNGSTPEVTPEQPLDNYIHASVPEDHVPPAPEHGVAEETSTVGTNMGKFNLMYLPCSRNREFVFVVGQRVNLQPLLKSSEDAVSPQKDYLTYFVTPPLPAGLELDTKTGTICGQIKDPGNYTGFTEHTIKVGVRILAAWNNMVLGSLTLCEVKIKVRIVNFADLQHQIRWIQEGPGDSLKIEFNDLFHGESAETAGGW
jgi:hypothetical protein